MTGKFDLSAIADFGTLPPLFRSDAMHSGDCSVARPSCAIRCLLFLGAMVLGGMLVLAGRLTPDPRGLGTHQQLGFPPCSLRQAVGIRCPACGMTTSWAYVTRGQWPSALSVSVTGTTLAFASLLAVPWMTVTAIGGRWWFRPTDTGMLVMCLTLVVLVITEWVLRLSVEGTAGGL